MCLPSMALGQGMEVEIVCSLTLSVLMLSKRQCLFSSPVLVNQTLLCLKQSCLKLYPRFFPTWHQKLDIRLAKGSASFHDCLDNEGKELCVGV